KLLETILQCDKLPIEAKLSFAKRSFQHPQELASKYPAEDLHGQQEPITGADPLRVVRRQAAARNDAMHMGMVLQVLTPGVEHREKADLGAQQSGIFGHLLQGLRHGAKQNSINDTLVL